MVDSSHFLSPVTNDRAVRFHHVPDGVYEIGGARINQPEARALVSDIVRNLKDPAFRQRGLTIGVVTFNAEQQRLIEDLLDNERRKDPNLESWFAEDTLEPLMVKNLESVQGDERDIIYFSITYGPDKLGRVSMNFGPLNRDGGQRRLNVAITRARHELRVFSSLRGEQIDLSRTEKQGVRDLKRFLEYAEYGSRAFAMTSFAGDVEFQSPLEEAVAIALRERGWEVHPQVGVSKYRIDLAVVDPDSPGRYLAGVECDGVTYHCSATARDRDKLRESVLRNLGWEIIRIWSTDWWTDPVGALERLDQRLRTILETARRTRAASASQDVVRENIESQGVPAAGSSRTGTVVPYRMADLRTIPVDQSRFYDRDYTPTIRTLVSVLIQEEGPIRDEVLIRRIASIHGFQRAGSRIRDRVLTVARRHPIKTKEDVGIFFWPSEGVKANWSIFRRPQTGGIRAVEDFPMEELRVLANYVIEMGYEGEEALREMASFCGIARLSSNARARLQLALIPDKQM